MSELSRNKSFENEVSDDRLSDYELPDYELPDYGLPDHELSGQTSCALTGSFSTRLLQRPSPIDYRESQAAQLAAPLTGAGGAEQLAVMIFRLCQEWFALPAQFCRQAIAPIPAHTLPHRSNSILLGIVNVSGQMLLKVSLLELLGSFKGDMRIEPGDASDASTDDLNNNCARYPRMVVIERANAEGAVEDWVFEVDKLEGIYALETDRLELPSAGTQVSEGSCTCQVFRWQNTAVSLLDDARLFEALRQRAL